LKDAPERLALECTGTPIQHRRHRGYTEGTEKKKVFSVPSVLNPARDTLHRKLL